MKKLYYFTLALLIVMAACKKDEDDEPEIKKADITQLNNGVTTSTYAPFTKGSTFDYKYETFTGEENATWTVLDGKEIDGKYYVEIQGFLGALDNGYFNCEEGVYTTYMPSTTMTPEMKMVYMKENVPEGTEWIQTIETTANGITIQNKYIFSYVGKLDTKTVEGEEYSDIIHIHLDLYTVMMGQEFLASTDDYYWAYGVGLIEKSGLSGNIYLLDYNIVQ